MATTALMQDKNSPAEMATLMGGMVNQWNNPFVYLVLMMFAQRMWGNDGIGGNGNVELNARINELQSQMQDYHNRYCVICRRRDTHTVRLSVFLSNSNTHKDVIQRFETRLFCLFDTQREIQPACRASQGRISRSSVLRPTRCISTLQSYKYFITCRFFSCL